ncbi:ABC transporter permease subunit [Robertmurraya korlensis]|uniref:ABC transporter permease subunit n=1 Tax=Robertmurraya korlensis TaxID=519977 RepID=UPI000824A085|nr:ABC transporter permease subunit [Robertmurraya korlensis]
MNIFLHELRAYRKSTIIWTISLMVLVLFFMALFPSFTKDAEQVNELLKTLPEALRKAVGIEIGSFTSILGFYSYVFMYITLCGAIQAMMIGASILSKEVREKTVDFLLTKPVSRSTVIVSKLSAAFVSIAITSLFFVLWAYFIALYVRTDDFNEQAFFLLSFTLFFVQVMFLAIGVIASMLLPKLKSVLSISLGVVFAFFFIGMFGSTVGEASVRYITPFKYFDSMYIIKNSQYEWSYLIVGLMWVITALVASFFIYTKRDMDAV